MTRILFQGDSITDCGRDRSGNTLAAGSGLGTGYPTFVAAYLLAHHPETQWDIINRAISGNRIVDLYARWKADALNLRPDILSIMIGVNDTWHEFQSHNGVDVPRYARFYRELLEWTKRELPNIKFILFEPYVHEFGAVGEGWKQEIDQRRAIVKDLAAEFNAAFIPTQTILDNALAKAPQEYWTHDGVHPKAAGHMLFAEEWLKAAKLL